MKDVLPEDDTSDEEYYDCSDIVQHTEVHNSQDVDQLCSKETLHKSAATFLIGIKEKFKLTQVCS